MSKNRKGGLAATLERYTSKLSSRALTLVMLALFLADVAIPDPLPFIDEIVLGIATILLARWQSRRAEPDPPAPKPPPKNVTPRD